MPTVVYAASNQVVARFIDSVAVHVLNPLIELAFAVAVIIFLWGIFEYFLMTTDPGKRSEGAKHILWGVIGMFIMVGAYGIIYLVINTIGAPVPAGL